MNDFWTRQGKARSALSWESALLQCSFGTQWKTAGVRTFSLGIAGNSNVMPVAAMLWKNEDAIVESWQNAVEKPVLRSMLSADGKSRSMLQPCSNCSCASEDEYAEVLAWLKKELE